ncbi:unnamed protein product [Schistosoma mattheei]|uniref:Uncharacterized protein n=1 Tax=Schistosoma mattheei TaxID=31246 RepID=A0A3P8IYI1_9TREM|nr:unnamed protein product [Schistosoma mattheei]
MTAAVLKQLFHIGLKYYLKIDSIVYNVRKSLYRKLNLNELTFDSLEIVTGYNNYEIVDQATINNAIRNQQKIIDFLNYIILSV